MGVGVHFTCHSLSHIFPSLWSVYCTLYSVPWRRKNVEGLRFKLVAGNYSFIYIKKELNVKTQIWPRSSFRSVPFGKKGIVKKKGIVPLSFRSFESFLNACSPAYNSRISKCNYNFPFNWNVPILVGNDYWTCQEAVYTNKPPFTIMYSICEV